MQNCMNKKSELMLMRCMRAYSSFCSQVILVYFHSRSSMLTILRSLLPVLVMLSSMSVPICNHFQA